MNYNHQKYIAPEQLEQQQIENEIARQKSKLMLLLDDSMKIFEFGARRIASQARFY